METLLLITTGFIGSIAATVYAMKWYFSHQSEMAIATAGYTSAQSVLFKKFPEADITLQRGLFLRIGFIISLLLMIIIFSLTFYFQSPGIVNYDDPFKDTFEIIDAPRTVRDEPAKQTPPPTVPKKIETLINIELIDVDETLKDNDLKKEEINPDTKIETYFANNIPDEKINEPDVVYPWAQKMPSFPGGDSALLAYLGTCTYPPFARENDIEGTVFVQFVVDKDGSVTDAKVVRSPDRILSEAALKHIKNMPNWEAGMQNNRPVKVRVVSKIAFTLRGY